MKVYKGTLVDTDGKLFPVHLPKNDYINEARARIEGWIEQRSCVYENKPSFILMDEEGRLKQLPLNQRASDIVGYLVVGPVIFIPQRAEEITGHA